MKWTTKVDILPSKEKITYNDHLVLLGSCFSNEIGKKLSHLKFQSTYNPLGISFNPISIFKSLETPDFSSNNFITHDGLYFHYDFHSEIYGESIKELQTKINKHQSTFLEKIKQCNWLVLTFGTAIVHELVSTNSVVSNNHKQAKNQFRKKSLTVSEIVSKFKRFQKQLNSKTQIILNVSPIRHTREGLPENQLSKSILRVACSEIESLFDHVTYLPTYEVMIDELRDYRFYKSDLIHPSQEAVDYIFERFTESFFEIETQKAISQVEKLLADLNHKPLFPKSNGHLKFISTLINKLNNSPHNFESEIATLNQQLNELI